MPWLNDIMAGSIAACVCMSTDQGPMKLNSFFQDKKIPLYLRDRIPLVTWNEQVNATYSQPMLSWAQQLAWWRCDVNYYLMPCLVCHIWPAAIPWHTHSILRSCLWRLLLAMLRGCDNVLLEYKCLLRWFRFLCSVSVCLSVCLTVCLSAICFRLLLFLRIWTADSLRFVAIVMNRAKRAKHMQPRIQLLAVKTSLWFLFYFIFRLQYDIYIDSDGLELVFGCE